MQCVVFIVSSVEFHFDRGPESVNVESIFMSWFDDLKTPRIKTQVSSRVSKVPEGLWVKCALCGEILQSKTLKENLQVCGDCGHHFRMSAAERIGMLSDEGSFEEYAEELVS